MTDQLHRLAAARGGIFTTADARHVGYTPAQIRTRTGRGEWHVLRRGFYCFASGSLAPTSDAQSHRLQSLAVLAACPGAVASHRTAAALYDLPLLGALDPRTHVTYDPNTMRTPSYRRDVNLHAARLEQADVGERVGLPLTRPARTVIDLARWSDLIPGVVAADAALHSGLVTFAGLAHVMTQQQRWPLIGRAGAVMELIDPASESPLESFARVVLVQGGVRNVISQVNVFDRAGFIGRADFAIDGTSCLIEADGLMKYDTADVLRAEKLRQERLERAGYTVVRLTWADLERAPRDVVTRVQRAAAHALPPDSDGRWQRAALRVGEAAPPHDGEPSSTESAA